MPAVRNTTKILDKRKPQGSPLQGGLFLWLLGGGGFGMLRVVCSSLPQRQTASLI